MFPHARRRRLLAVAAIASTVALTAACSGGGESAEANEDGTPSGDLLVLTWRTDLLEDGTFDEYAERFNEEYPDVNVEFEGLTDYEGEVRTRMNTDDYGDVLGVVGTVTPDQFPDFFEPLGDVEELEKEYRFLRDKTFDGQAYGIPVVGNTQGIVYNKTVWEDAGVTEPPTTPEAFVDALKAIKADDPEVVPLYTNYKDGWPLTQWEGHRGEITANPDYVNEMAQSDAPWTEGTDHFVIDSLLWDVVNQGLTEEDPTTTNWEESKSLLANGKIGSMVLGSWAIQQMQAAAEDAGTGADTIGYLPFPHQVDGTFYAAVGGDYNLAINKNSENKVAARAWIDWFNTESGYAEANGGLSPLKEGPTPDTLKDFEALGVEYLELTPAPAGKESLFADIDAESEVGTNTPDYRQRIVDAARGASGETKDQIFDDLNSKWAAGRAAVEG
jgi:ABC-type glycerol-3-phosphate transport system substrate-binding protein